MKFRQVLPLSLTALLMSVLLTISAFAATEPSAVGFLDIPSDSACYEAVTYLADRGITMSIGNQCFSPEELITVRQWAAMLNRAYQADAAEVYGDGCVLRCYREGWLTETAMEAPDFRMCRSALLESAFHAAGLPVYDYALYPDGEELSEYENVLRVGTELGLCSQESSPLDLMGLLTKCLFIYFERKNGSKKDAHRRHPIHLIILFKFKAVAERRQWSSAASKPRRKTRVKLCPHFWAAKVPSHQICRLRSASR